MKSKSRAIAMLFAGAMAVGCVVGQATATSTSTRRPGPDYDYAAMARAHEQHAPSVAGSADVTRTVYLPLSVRGGSAGGPSPTPTPPPTGTATPAPGAGMPPANAVLSRAYKDVIDKHYAAYPPKAGECSKEVHARYWAYGPDGKVYPTWHPPVDPATGCRFGHEHGRNPAGSKLAAESLAFGYVNEQLSPDDPQYRRDEDHVGHKIEWVNDAAVTAGNGLKSIEGVLPPIGAQVKATCSILLKVHQGSHSPDALSNNLHELFYYLKCSDGTSLIWQGLVGFGDPGAIKSQCRYILGLPEYVNVAQPVSPPNSPGGAGHRMIPDPACTEIMLVPSGQTSDYRYFHEAWEMAQKIDLNGSDLYVRLAPYFDVHNPARYFDPAASTNMSRTLDLCYTAGANQMRGGACEDVRAIPGKLSFDDTRSPFNGARRVFQLQNVSVRNLTGKTVWYSDPLGQRVQLTPDPAQGIVIKIIVTPSNDARMAGGVNWVFDQNIVAGDYGGPSTHVHAPN